MDSGHVGDNAKDGFEHGAWEWSREQLHQVGALIMDLVAEHLSGVADRPVFRPYPVDTTLSLEGAATARTGAPGRGCPAPDR
jgi:hypothetical protein